MGIANCSSTASLPPTQTSSVSDKQTQTSSVSDEEKGTTCLAMGLCCNVAGGDATAGVVAATVGSVTGSCVTGAASGLLAGLAYQVSCGALGLWLFERLYPDNKLENRQMSIIEKPDQSYMNAGNDRAEPINQPVTTQPKGQISTTESGDDDRPPSYDQVMNDESTEDMQNQGAIRV